MATNSKVKAAKAGKLSASPNKGSTTKAGGPGVQAKLKRKRTGKQKQNWAECEKCRRWCVVDSPKLFTQVQAKKVPFQCTDVQGQRCSAAQ